MHFENKHWKLQISIRTCLIIDRLCPWCWGINKELIVENNIHMLPGWRARGDWECCTDTVANIPVCSAEQKICLQLSFFYYHMSINLKYYNNLTTYVLVIFNKVIFIDLNCWTPLLFSIFLQKHPFLKSGGGIHIFVSDLWLQLFIHALFQHTGHSQWL